ncbi:MAG: SOS response-associated peptidase [Nitrospinae bacterium]|nr:SOS response-associated peptidase [Nitrospinota bacterium]MZH04511.1 SOS response-associated peptidase [Nitrospinota bacterium]MZH13461.1 SOS response-associated peptidase [Nitrospinota bacterium]
MCGRYTLTKSIKTIESHFKPVRISLKHFPSFNIAPSQLSAIITHSSNQLNLAGMKWGLIPSWSKDGSMGNKLINARSETLHEKPSFRDSFKKKRCLVPADGFIEWKEKKPYFIRMRNQALFAFAGLWSPWDSGEEPINTFTIITTEANKTLSPLHSRMPVILHPDSYETWLTADPKSLTSLFSGSLEKELEYYEISTAINSPKNNQASLLNPAGQSSFTF